MAYFLLSAGIGSLVAILIYIVKKQRNAPKEKIRKPFFPSDWNTKFREIIPGEFDRTYCEKCGSVLWLEQSVYERHYDAQTGRPEHEYMYHLRCSNWMFCSTRYGLDKAEVVWERPTITTKKKKTTHEEMLELKSAFTTLFSVVSWRRFIASTLISYSLFMGILGFIEGAIVAGIVFSGIAISVWLITFYFKDDETTADIEDLVSKEDE